MFALGIGRRFGLATVALLAASPLLVSCGGGDSDELRDQADEPAPVEEQASVAEEREQVPSEQAEPGEPEEEQVAERKGAEAGIFMTVVLDDESVQDLAGVETAVVRIVAEGIFQDPDAGEFQFAGSGSGFIIDESGLVVTNNHVVTGAALLQAFVGGDEDNPINARILGVSECSDLAVIDLEGGGYPFLRWHEGVITVGLSAFAAGFPLGDPAYTLTSGIVSKSDADGESNWASVDRVLEHDADILPGNSGGPLVTEAGRVIGINYAGNDAGQDFAIRADEALRILEDLIAGNDVDSIGVNGQAIVSVDAFGDEVSGIWVASVSSGSSADKVGLRSGDIITRMEGFPLARDGTMSSYCDILRTHGIEDVLAIEVLRFETGQVLEGRLNSGQTLSESFSFGERGGEIGDGSVVAGTSYSGFTSVMDDSGLLFVDVPAEWSDVDGGPWLLDGDVVGLSVTAAESIEQFLRVWTEPGMFFGASTDLVPDPGTVLDVLRPGIPLDSQCEYVGREPYEDPLYSGLFDAWENCGGEDVLYISLVALPPDDSLVINVQVQVVSDADFEALDRILNSFFVDSGENATAPLEEPPSLGYSEYVLVTDDTGNIEVELPAEWSDIRGEPNDLGFQVTAAPDVDAWETNWDLPGTYIAVTGQLPLDPAALLDNRDFSGPCDYEGRDVYQDPLYSGFQDVWSDCGGIGTLFIIVAAMPPDGAFIVEVQTTLVFEEDFEALERLLGTFFVVEPPA